ncbi:MAG TPA: hypothetical protein VGQ90_05405 [Stellaceae bacterium]|nr:hypothetical protein [Stellaceae bacterium]
MIATVKRLIAAFLLQSPERRPRYLNLTRQLAYGALIRLRGQRWC